MGSTLPCENNWATTDMRSSEIQWRKLKLKLRDNIFLTTSLLPLPSSMDDSPGDVKWRTCDVGEAKEGSDIELWCRWSNRKAGEWVVLILQPFHCFTYITAHSPTVLSFYLCHSSFSNPSGASPMSQLIFQPLFRFSYITGSSLNFTSWAAHAIWFFRSVEHGFNFNVCVFQCQPTALLRASGSTHGG